MKEMWKVLYAQRAETEAHPFFGWLSSDDVPLDERFVFTPVLIDFVMGFADLNKWFLRYSNPGSDWERAINEHTSEDATHSLLFVQNWTHLNIGDTPRWPASKALWWMFQASDCLVVRRLGMAILDLSVRFPDPLVRFPIMEAIEICGDIFFGHSTRIAEKIMEQQQVDHVYYGPYHRARETGHLQADEGSFINAQLSPDQRREAERGVRAVFGQFRGLFDHLLDFSLRATSDPASLARAIDHEYAQAMSPPASRAGRPGREAPQYQPRIRADRIHPEQAPLVALLDERRARLGRHGLVSSLRPGPFALERLQNFAPIWGVDVVSYRDFNELVLRYPQPSNDAERTVNRWSKDLASHGVLYLRDWKTLALDELLGWKMGDAVTYYFLSEQTEVHRRNMSKVKKLAMAHPAPLLRWWLMLALEQSGDVLFEAIRPLALQLEAGLGAPLDYWAYRHGLTEPGEHDAAAYAFLEDGITPQEALVIRQIIDTVFDNIEEQFEQCDRLLHERVFSTRASSLPPHASHIAELVRARHAARAAVTA